MRQEYERLRNSDNFELSEPGTNVQWSQTSVISYEDTETTIRHQCSLLPQLLLLTVLLINIVLVAIAFYMESRMLGDSYRPVGSLPRPNPYVGLDETNLTSVRGTLLTDYLRAKVWPDTPSA